jgi:hypothetical protein
MCNIIHNNMCNIKAVKLFRCHRYYMANNYNLHLFAVKQHFSLDLVLV